MKDEVINTLIIIGRHFFAPIKSLIDLKLIIKQIQLASMSKPG